MKLDLLYLKYIILAQKLYSLIISNVQILTINNIF